MLRHQDGLIVCAAGTRIWIKQGMVSEILDFHSVKASKVRCAIKQKLQSSCLFRFEMLAGDELGIDDECREEPCMDFQGLKT